MKEMMKLSFALKSDYLTAVRLATGGLCSAVGLSLDDSEDCKVCVTESLLLLLHGGFSHASILFSEEEGLCVRLFGEGEQAKASVAVEDEIACALLEALVSDLTIVKQGEIASEISFRFGR